MADGPTVDDPIFGAAVTLIGRTGCKQFRVGFTDKVDGDPVVWWTSATYSGGRAEAAAGMDPVSAVLRLCAELVDGGRCVHCGNPTGFDEHFERPEPRSLPGLKICWYRWNPELRTFRRGCE